LSGLSGHSLGQPRSLRDSQIGTDPNPEPLAPLANFSQFRRKVRCNSPQRRRVTQGHAPRRLCFRPECEGITLTSRSYTKQITSKGLVTIPQAIRNRSGLLPHTEVEFELRDDHVRIRKARRPASESARGRLALELLRGTADAGMSTDEILALYPRRSAQHYATKVKQTINSLQARLTRGRGVLVDSNVLLDVATNDPDWGNWSARALAESAEYATLIIDPILHAEVSIGYSGRRNRAKAPKSSMVFMARRFFRQNRKGPKRENLSR